MANPPLMYQLLHFLACMHVTQLFVMMLASLYLDVSFTVCVLFIVFFSQLLAAMCISVSVQNAISMKDNLDNCCR
jgi:hypothetical protein